MAPKNPNWVLSQWISIMTECTDGAITNSSSPSYYRARYYDQNAGRFLSEDPLGFNAKRFNFYSYVLNNPLRFADPLGLCPPQLDSITRYHLDCSESRHRKTDVLVTPYMCPTIADRISWISVPSAGRRMLSLVMCACVNAISSRRSCPIGLIV